MYVCIYVILSIAEGYAKQAEDDLFIIISAVYNQMHQIWQKNIFKTYSYTFFVHSSRGEI